MNERQLEKACHDVLRAKLTPMPLLWHINDQITGGQPDTEVVWNGHTTKIEFKKLRGSQNIHHVWEDGRQLITCVKYERASGGRCWIVAYSEKAKLTLIYRPSALLDKKIPVPANKTMNFELLWNRGALQIDGISEGHIAVAELIRETHK